MALDPAFFSLPVAATVAEFFDTGNLFAFGNAFVVPFWLLMVAAPRSDLTKRLMDSNVQYAALASIYAFLIYQAITLHPESLSAFSSPNITPADISKGFGEETAAAAGWVHYLVLDLWAGRTIWRDGLDRGIPFRHSVLFTLFAGPVGVLSHIVTSYLWTQLVPAKQTEES